MTYTKDSKDEEVVQFESNKLSSQYSRLRFDINDLSSVRRVYPGYGIPSIIFMLNDGHTWPPLYFYKGGSKEFLQELKSMIGPKLQPPLVVQEKVLYLIPCNLHYIFFFKISLD